MDANTEDDDVVHPEVRAHINNLISALGSAATGNGAAYQPGDDALDVIRDIKRWLQFYDEKTNRMDVARCLADANIVSGDLLPIISLWTERAQSRKQQSRLATACYELLTPLTWPIGRDKETMTVNHYRHIEILHTAQVNYKKDIINYQGAQILRTAVRMAISAMTTPIRDRSDRDHALIRMMLYFVRNVAMIAPGPGTTDLDEMQLTSRSILINAFAKQDILTTLLALSSGMGENYKGEDVIVMEIIFHLVKRVDLSQLFSSKQTYNQAQAGKMLAAIKQEAAMHRPYKKTAPTRHSRFGTMVWVKRSDGKESTFSGQDMLTDAGVRDSELERAKTFRPPRRAAKDEMQPKDLGSPVTLDERASSQLRRFVEDFLDSGFNPLFQQARKTVDREGLELTSQHSQQFFYVVAWFLEAERARKQAAKRAKAAKAGDAIRSYNLVAAVLNQEMFITLRRGLIQSLQDSDYRTLNSAMRCFSQILLTVQDMAESEDDEDQEIAENMLSRLFYEETTHDAILDIVRKYKYQGFDYLDACTELVHTYVRVLEAYSKQNVDLQVRSKRRARRKAKAKKAVGVADAAQDAAEESAEDIASAAMMSQERKFDFERFANRFAQQAVVDTFVKYTEYYRDLNSDQLKRAHRFLHRVAFKQDMSVMLFRVDIVQLLVNMVQGPEALDSRSTSFKQWDDLVKHILRLCVQKIEERPTLIIEMLFSKMSSTAYYLEHGHEKVVHKATPRPAAELEFRREEDLGAQIAIAVGCLLDKNQGEHIAWVKHHLTKCATERKAFEDADKAFASIESANAPVEDTPSTEDGREKAPDFVIRTEEASQRTAILKNSYLRLLMKICGFTRLAPSLEETLETIWIIPGTLSAEHLTELISHITSAEHSPPVFDDERTAEQQLRRKTAPRKKASFDDDEDQDVEDMLDDGEVLFPPNSAARTSKAIDGEDAAPKKRRLKRRRASPGSDDEGAQLSSSGDEASRRLKRKKRAQKELEKARKIKSELYVHPSDDETDEERDDDFFQKEEATRQRVARMLMQTATGKGDALSGAFGPGEKEKSRITEAQKRRLLYVSSEEEGANSDQSDSTAATKPAESAASNKRKRKMPAKRPAIFLDSDDDSDADAAAGKDSRLSSQPSSPIPANQGDEDDAMPDAVGDDETPATSEVSPPPEDSDLQHNRSTEKSKASVNTSNRLRLKEVDVNAVSHTKSVPSADAGQEEDDDGPVVSSKRRRIRATGPFEDSDDE